MLVFTVPWASVIGWWGYGKYHRSLPWGVLGGGAVVETVGIKSMVGAIESGSHLNHFW